MGCGAKQVRKGERIFTSELLTSRHTLTIYHRHVARSLKSQLVLLAFVSAYDNTRGGGDDDIRVGEEEFRIPSHRPRPSARRHLRAD